MFPLGSTFPCTVTLNWLSSLSRQVHELPTAGGWGVGVRVFLEAVGWSLWRTDIRIARCTHLSALARVGCCRGAVPWGVNRTFIVRGFAAALLVLLLWLLRLLAVAGTSSLPPRWGRGFRRASVLRIGCSIDAYACWRCESAPSWSPRKTRPQLHLLCPSPLVLYLLDTRNPAARAHRRDYNFSSFW